MSPQVLDTVRLAELCAGQDPAQGLEGVAAALAGQLPGLQFRPALSRGGWHRLGGVVDREHRRVARHLRQ